MKRLRLVLLTLVLLILALPCKVFASDQTISDSTEYTTAVDAREITIPDSGVTTLNAVMSDGFHSWYRVHFDKPGILTYDSIVNGTNKEDSHEWYTTDLEKIVNNKYGNKFLHGVGDYYLKVSITGYSYYKDKPVNITLTEDESRGNYCTLDNNRTAKAYVMKPEVNVYSLPSSYQSRWYQIDVPAGKKAKILLDIDAGADLSSVVNYPYKLHIIRASDGRDAVADDIKTSLTLNGFAESKPDWITNEKKPAEDWTEGTYYIEITGGSGQWFSLSYSLVDCKTESDDKKAPTVAGVKNHGVYTHKVTIKFSDDSGIKLAKLNGKKVDYGITVSKKGYYNLVVTDKAGNKKVVKFRIK